MKNASNFVFVFAIGNCDFEIDKCSWSDVHTDDFDWLSGSGTTTSSSTGPRTDHTTGNATGKINLIHEEKTCIYIIFSFFMFLSLKSLIISRVLVLNESGYCFK